MKMPSMATKPITLEEEYNKKTGITSQDIVQLRQWLKTQPHLPEKQISDLDLILAYHCCNCSAELAKQVLDLNLTVRTLFSNLFKNRMFDAQVEQSLNNILMTLLPERSREGYGIFYCHFLNYDPKDFNYRLTIRTVFMIIDIWQYVDGTWPGLHLIVDLEGVTLSHLSKVDLRYMQQFLYYLQEALPVKLKGMHFLNAPSFMDKLLMMMRPFIKTSLMDMLHIHTVGSKTIDNFVPIEALPKECGGKSKSFTELRDDLIGMFKDHQEYFDKENEKRVIESLRPGKPTTISDIFGGVEGSFKKLEID